MSSSITRSPSTTLIHDSLVDYHQRPAQAQKACEDRLEQYLSADPQHALERGHRLLELVRDVPKPADDGTPASGAPALPGDLPDMQSYLGAARPLVEQIAHAVDAKSPIFHLARAALRPADIEDLTSALLNAILVPVFQVLAQEGVDPERLSEDLRGVLADSFLAQDTLFRYAMNLSPETLQALSSDKAESFRRGLGQMQTAIQAKLPELLEQIMNPQQVNLAPLNPEDQAKYDRMEAWAAEVRPELLTQLESAAGDDSTSAQMSAHIKREMLLLMAEALGGFDVDEQLAFHRSPAGREIREKSALLVPDQENNLLRVLVQDAFQRHVQASRAERAAQSEFGFDQLVAFLEQQGGNLPEDPEQRAAFMRGLEEGLQTMMEKEDSRS